MTQRKYRVTAPVAFGRRDYLGRGTVERYLPGDIVEVDDTVARRLKQLEPYYEPQKRKPAPKTHHTRKPKVVDDGES